MSGAIAQMLRRPPQSFWLVGAVGLNAIVSLLTIPLFVELLSREDLAILAQAGGIALAASTVCSLGANTIGPHIASGKIAELKSYDELLGGQVFAGIVLFAALLVPALTSGLSWSTLSVFGLNFGAGVLSAICPNWLMVQQGLAQRIFAYHALGRALYVGVLGYFALVDGGLVVASIGLFAGSLLTTVLVLKRLAGEMSVRPVVRPIRRGVLQKAVTVMSAPLATAAFASAAPFVLQAWMGLGAVGLYYIVERARVFVSEILRTAETPYYQAVASGDGRGAFGDAWAMPFAAVAMAAVLPLLVAWGPKLAVIEMLRSLWPYLSVFCLALALSTRAVTQLLDGQRAFGGGAVLRVAATLGAAVALAAMCASGVEAAYAAAIVFGELLLALLAVGYSRLRGR